MVHLRNTVPLSYWYFLSLYLSVTLSLSLTLYPCKLLYKTAQSVKYNILTPNKIKLIITVIVYILHNLLPCYPNSSYIPRIMAVFLCIIMCIGDSFLENLIIIIVSPRINFRSIRSYNFIYQSCSVAPFLPKPVATSPSAYFTLRIACPPI